MLETVGYFAAILIVLILAHEIGHYVTAKTFGVRVEEFGLGFPPRIIGKKWGETTYSINALPLGGFCKMAGEEDPEAHPRSLASKSRFVRILVLAAGSLMNALLPILLFSIAFMVPHSILSGQVIVEQVIAGTPAAQAGIEVGDTILKIDGKAVQNLGDLHRTLQLNLGMETEIAIQQSDGNTEIVTVVPRWQPPEGQGATGMTIQLENATVVKERYPFWEAIPKGVVECIETFVLFKNAIISMIIGTVPVILAGPVGIAQLTGEFAEAGFSPLMEFAAFLSINLAIVNIFPLPALDGGRIVFVLLEWVRRGKRVPAKVEGMIHWVGFMLLIGAMLLVTYQDILRIITGESLIP